MARFEHRGEDRIELAKAWCSRIAERFGEPGRAEVGLPLTVGGLSFAVAGDPGHEGCWRNWPDLSLFVPKSLIFRGALGPCREARIGRAALPGVALLPTAPTSARPEDERGRYESLVRATVTAIAAGEVEKVVLARAAQLGVVVDPVRALRQLRESHPAAICYAFGRSGEVFLGASPETLVALEAGRLATQAVAGTTRADRDLGGVALRDSPKDDHEHQLVVDSIVSSLETCCDEVKVEPRRLARAGAVQHIVTPIEARPREDVRALDIVAALHPTAALCGTPRAQAARYIARHEGFDRGFYGAPIGWLDATGEGVFAVAIRSALVATETTAFVGAGVVAGSAPAAEWDETEAKVGPVRAALLAAEEVMA
ncbi:MAG: chorismate-binding protein [Polyangiaceae bacterium]